ncbi:MAG: transporter substrate-binding domain-containing protein [Crocinitomicaceae bacterium]|nr:transporter substrate-binding domain-containing protein [Crocinitomicaceae bacterium]
MKILFALFVFILVGCHSNDSEIEALKKEVEELKKQKDFTFLENNYKDTVRVYLGTPGYQWPEEVKLITKMFKDLNINYKILNKWKGIDGIDYRLAPILTKSADISVYNITITEERKKDVNFSKPYLFDEVAILSFKSYHNNSSDLIGKKVAAFGTVSKWLKKNVRDIRIFDLKQYTGSTEELFNKLKNGEVDAWVSSKIYLERILKKHGNNRFSISKEYLYKEPIGIAVSKDKKELLNIINEYLDLKLNL